MKIGTIEPRNKKKMTKTDKNVVRIASASGEFILPKTGDKWREEECYKTGTQKQLDDRTEIIESPDSESKCQDNAEIDDELSYSRGIDLGFHKLIIGQSEGFYKSMSFKHP
jgi:hypothetical protein